MSRAFLLLICLPLLATAQVERQDAKGIDFTELKNWQQVLQKAKRENKYIFVDFFATWCVPCKELHEDVFRHPEVGEYFNSRFVSISIQTDETEKDGKWVKSWYPDAIALKEKYAIRSVPTLLFLSPDGRLLEKVAYAPPKEQLIASAREAIQYDTISKEYGVGGRNIFSRPIYSFDYLKRAFSISEQVGDGIFRSMANEYIARQLISGAEDQTFNPENVRLIMSFTTRSTDPGFQLLYKNKVFADQAMSKDREWFHPASYVDATLDPIIFREEVFDPYMKSVKEQGGADDLPWNKIYAAIERKYNKQYASRIVGNYSAQWYLVQVNWYKEKKNAERLSQYRRLLCASTAEYFKAAGEQLDISDLNNKSWAMFENCSDPAQLGVAIDWMGAMVWRLSQPKLKYYISNNIDTYANLLYRAGRKDEAIRWEEKALEFVKADLNMTRRAPKAQKKYEDTISKMNAGVPTWSQD